MPISQTLSTLQYHQNRRTHQTPALTSNDQTSSTNPGRTNPQPQTRSQNGPVRDSASKARNLPPRAALHPPRQAQHLGLRSTIRQRRVRLRQRVDRHITHIQHQQQRGRLHGEDGRRQSRRSLLVEKRQAKEQSVVNRQQGLRFERVARHYVRFCLRIEKSDIRPAGASAPTDRLADARRLPGGFTKFIGLRRHPQNGRNTTEQTEALGC